jgi:hypothetical protein
MTPTKPTPIEVDQSGRIEFTKEDTALAFSNGEQFCLLIPARVKRACIRRLRERRISGPTLYVRLFAVGLYFLLRDYIGAPSRIVIDIEYFGRENQIKEHLVNLFRRHGCWVDASEIQFQQIGKKSPAHLLALGTFRGEKKPDLVLSQTDLLGEF